MLLVKQFDNIPLHIYRPSPLGGVSIISEI